MHIPCVFLHHNHFVFKIFFVKLTCVRLCQRQDALEALSAYVAPSDGHYSRRAETDLPSLGHQSGANEKWTKEQWQLEGKQTRQ